MSIEVYLGITGLVTGCAYAMVLLKRYLQLQSKELTFAKLLEQVKVLRIEMLELGSSNPDKMNDAMNKQLNKYAWHTLHLENESTTTTSINQIIRASEYAEKCLKFGQITDVHIRAIHGKLTQNHYFAGQYRNYDVKITAVPNSKYPDCYPPQFTEVEELMVDFVEWLNNQRYTDLIDVLKIAIEAKVRFLEIHPFLDGNGRTSRAILNGLLRQVEFPWIEIPSMNKYLYCLALEKYYHEKNMDPIREFVAQCVKEALQNIVHEMRR